MSVAPFGRRASRQFSPTDRLIVVQLVSLSILPASRNSHSEFAAVANAGCTSPQTTAKSSARVRQIAHSAKRSAKRCGICRKTLRTFNAGGSGGESPEYQLSFFITILLKLLNNIAIYNFKFTFVPRNFILLHLIFIIMLNVETEQAIELLDALKHSTSEVVPHFVITFMLYRCRFEKKDIFSQLFRDFVAVGYNPLRKMTTLESIMVENIIANL